MEKAASLKSMKKEGARSSYTLWEENVNKKSVISLSNIVEYLSF